MNVEDSESCALGHLMCLLLVIYGNEKSNTSLLTAGNSAYAPHFHSAPLKGWIPSDFLAPGWDSQLPGCSSDIPSPVLLPTLFQLQSTELIKTLAFNHKTCEFYGAHFTCKHATQCWGPARGAGPPHTPVGGIR